MPDSVRDLWLRVVAGARQELEQRFQGQYGMDPERDLEALLAARWPESRRAVIERLATERSGGSDTLYQQALHRLERDIPQEYPYAR